MTGQEDGGAGVRGAPALCFEGVTFCYREGADPAVANLNLAVHPGELVALVGRNGSGKTTVARLANGLLRPTLGRVVASGLDTRHEADVWTIRTQVGLLFQDPETQIVGATVADDVAFGLENLGVPRAEMQVRVAAALAKVGLEEQAAVPVRLLSGGQKQRLALAGVLALEPRILVLDEPTSMLDRPTRVELKDLLAGLTEQGIAVVWVTQHMEEALWAHRLVAMDGGRVVFDGPPRGFFRDGRAERLGLDLPPAARVARVLQDEAGARLADILTEEELVRALREGEHGRD